MHGGLNHRVVRDIYQVLASYPAVKKPVNSYEMGDLRFPDLNLAGYSPIGNWG
jgi:hypothetical protein